MLKVLEVCESYGGGVKTHVDYLNQYLDRKKFSPKFVVSGARKNSTVPDEFIRFDNLSGYKNPIKIISSIRLIHHLVKSDDIRVIHAHSTIAAVLVAMYKLIYHSSVETVYTPHAYVSEKPLRKTMKRIFVSVERFYMRQFNYIINVSYQERDHALENKLASGNRLQVVRNGITPQTPPSVRHKLTEVVNVARCESQKNPLEFIDVAEKCQNIDQLHFTFVGDGKLLTQCRDLIKQKKLKNIDFVGFSNDVSHYLKAADLFFSSSLYEGLPYSVIEAEASGLPVLLTNVVGHTELFKQNGKLYNLHNTAEAAKFIQQLKADPAEIQRFSQNSYQLFENEFTIHKTIQQLENVYEGEVR